MTGTVDEDKADFSKFPASEVKKINEKIVSSRENSERFGYLRNSGAFDLSSSFLNKEKLPDATSEKELGNEYFKQKKFHEAIECYSRSIAFSPTSVAFANRAMAYLKVKKFVEAENDCTDALSLDDRYVKAYSRRLTARKELGKLEEAMEDADFAVRLEPNNPEIRKQFGEIKAMLERKLIQNVSAEKNSSAASKVSKAKGVYPVTGKTQNAEASVAQIMEPNGGNDKHALRTSVQDLASRAASRVMATAPKIIGTPTSAYQFEVLWRSLSNASAKQAQLLKTIPPSDLPKIFKNALSAPLLIEIIKCIATFFRDDTVFAVSMMDNLTYVPRFDMIIMCLSAMDRAELLRLWDEVFLCGQIQEDLRMVLVRLRPKYCYGEWESHILSS
ncbi:RNA polymerase II-associated protein 3 isoform X2 [Dendrobium catenatum]|uniref:RNA polymerase II-associated protein 3 isoform X2 n=1 Tax=Dendrobium catenatum TaxID=906689 RepID=UPI00109EEF96|nr:RNA polymerase II-associated protein 3 isoform X2 [Dendrobium catenatum]